MKVALIGNPNVGKTTIFNFLTKSNQKIGNYPGVTVQKKVGKLEDDIEIIDLPGIYSLDSLSIEEKITLDYIKNEKPAFILNVLDSSNLYRNLFLTLQLKKFNIPIVLVLNMMDIAKKNNILINIEKLSRALNSKVFLINANDKQSISELELYLRVKDYKLDEYKEDKNYNFKSPEDIYKKIDEILKYSVKTGSKNNSITEKIDAIVMNKFLAIPILILTFFLIFKITFSWIGDPLSSAMEDFIGNTFTPYVEGLISNTSPLFKSFILDGLIGGIGSIVVFAPIILSMFMCLTFLESCGYISRAAVIVDKFMRIFGLSGKAFLPIVMSFGCTVPAIMATRTFESEKDRKHCIFLLPLMSCNARLPVYVLFTGVFFSKHKEIVIMFLYLLGIILSIIIGFILNIFSKEKGGNEVFILEMPDYKLPSLNFIIKESFSKISSFIKKVGTLIFSISIVVWFLSNFNFSGFTEIENSFLFSIGNIIAPIFKPLNFGFWQAGVSLLTGLMAKEVIISTMGVIFGSNLEGALPLFFTPASSIAFLTFVLLYTPCISVLSTIKHEYGTKLMLISVVYQFAVAYSVSLLVFNIFNLIF